MVIMSYKKGIEKIPKIIKEGLAEEKGVAFFMQDKDENYRRITENVALVESIERGTEGEMSKLTLRFEGGERITTMAFINNLIQEGEFISTWGYFDEFNGKITYYCKGGCQRILSKLEEIEYVDVTIPYRMGVAELSKIVITPPCTNTEEIEEIEDTGIFYIKGNIKTLNETSGNENIIDTRIHKKFKAISFK